MIEDSNKDHNKKICIDCGIEVKVFRKKRCGNCYKKFKNYGAETTYINPKTGNADWGNYKDGFICSRCRFKLWSKQRKEKKKG